MNAGRTINELLRGAILAAAVGLQAGTIARADPVSAARGVLERVVGTDMAARIVLESISQVDGRDVYEYSAADGTLTVRGSSAVAMCRGVYDYLRAHNLGTVGWAGPRLDLPSAWPDAPATPGGTPFKIRHGYNVVTAGYTFPFWTWERWQQELDGLAMHGYNMMMAPVATEAILTRVWQDIGLTPAEIAEYFTGPAHLPWNRMGNIRQVGGTLTDAWHADQVALQHRILNRARELGIEPVVQGFAGFVPPGITRIHPGLNLHTSSNWGGFSGDNNTRSILPDEPLFAELMNRYITAWRNEFGEARYYLVDSFNEMDLPAGDPATLLAGYGRNTCNALVAADPDAIWVLQGWMFTYQTRIWTPTTVAALMNAVPDDHRLLVLDYAQDYTDLYGLGENAWQRYNAYEGKSWVMGYVPNMGGKTAYTGKMDYYASQTAATVQDAGRGNLVGFTVSGEGFDNNEVLFELMSDTAWSSTPIHLGPWLSAYARNRYGRASPEAAAAWEQLRHSVYRSFTDHPSFGWQKLSLARGTVYRGTGFIQAVQRFLSAAGTLGGHPNYRDDAIEMTALALGLRAEEYFVLANSAYMSGDHALCQTHADQAVELLLQADRLLESHSQHRLQRWIDLARAHNGTPAEKDAYERSARQIVTLWGPPINDYSCRVWSGLIRDFYVPRMQARITAMRAGLSFDRATWEAAWVNSTGVSPITPYADPAAKARELFEAAYAEVLDEQPDMDLIIGRWYPDQMNTAGVVLEWDFPAGKLAELEGVTFTYTAGAHRLDIRRAAIVADGVDVVVDEHNGSTGITHANNFYSLAVPAGTQANNSCTLRATVRSDGGTDSTGMVVMKLKTPPDRQAR